MDNLDRLGRLLFDLGIPAVPVDDAHNDLGKTATFDKGKHGFPCRFAGCKRVCLSVGGLNAHFNSHKANKPYACLLCERKFKAKTGLASHMRRSHGLKNKDFQCPFPPCEKVFSSRFDLEQHKRVHTGQRPYKCELCEHKYFKQTSGLYAHLRNVHHQEPNNLNWCFNSHQSKS